MKSNTATLKKRAAEHGEKAKREYAPKNLSDHIFQIHGNIFNSFSHHFYSVFDFQKSACLGSGRNCPALCGICLLRSISSQNNKSLLAGSLVIPQFDLSIGMGNDIFTSLHYYGIGDPLNLVSALVPSKYAAYAFSLLVYLRYYLAGFAFVLLAKYKKQSKTGACAGAMIYVFPHMQCI